MNAVSLKEIGERLKKTRKALKLKQKEYSQRRLKKNVPVKKKSGLLAGNTREIEGSGYRYPGIVYLDDEDIVAAPKKNDVLYIPPVECCPGDIRVYDLLAVVSALVLVLILFLTISLIKPWLITAKLPHSFCN